MKEPTFERYERELDGEPDQRRTPIHVRTLAAAIANGQGLDMDAASEVGWMLTALVSE